MLSSPRAPQPRGAGSIRYWTSHDDVLAHAIEILRDYLL